MWATQGRNTTKRGPIPGGLGLKLLTEFIKLNEGRLQIAPLRIGEEVTVLGMAPEEDCESEMFVRLKWGGRSMAVPLSQLEPLAADPLTLEAVADWHYWVDRGYEF